MKPLILFLIGLTVSNHLTYSQRQSDNWYFGAGAGISFMNGAPVSVSGGQMNQNEGVATISDANGNLLFYTDGATIWNKNHSIMQNGTGLYGDGISAQSAVIVPLPNVPDIYYVFTISNWTYTGNTRGLFYSIVDMRSGNGLGAVTTKNTLLNLSPREQVTSVLHTNCRDVWIVSHEKDNTNFLAYLLTTTGLQSTPVISPIGMSYTGFNRYGYLRFSSDGQKLCSTLGFETPGSSTIETVQLFDFNKSTGVVSNPITLATVNTLQNAYSSEFSADNTKLYTVAFNGSNIYQYDLSLGNSAAIIASRVNVASGPDIKSCLQMGPDKKIYVSKNGRDYLGMIRSPNNPGISCDYVDNAVSLNGKTGSLGLPNFMQSFFFLPYLGVDSSICPGASIVLSPYTLSGSTYLWQDGSVNPTFTATQSGQYWVEVTNGGCVMRDTIRIDPILLQTNLGSDTTICSNASIVLNATAGTGASYLWQDGATSPTYTVNSPGNYSVTVSLKGCSTSDAITINTAASPSVNLGSDTAICPNTTFLLNAFTMAGNTYKWQDGSAGSSILVSSQGKYWVNVNNNGCSITDTINVTLAAPSSINLGSDTTICLNQSLLLKTATISNATYTWQDGSSQPVFVVTKPGTYSLDVNTTCGILSDQIVVKTEDCTCEIHIPNAFSPDPNRHNDIFKPVTQHCNFTEYNLKIFNRWGERVFESNNPSIGWNGSYKGRLCDAGAYVFIFTYRANNNTDIKQVRGMLMLIR